MAADHQTVTVAFFGWNFDFGKCFGDSSQSNHIAGHHWLSYKINLLTPVTIQLRNGLMLLHGRREDDISKWQFFDLWSAQRHTLTEFFHLYNLFQMPNDHRMVEVGFFDSFLYSFKRISFNDPLNWSLSTSDGHPPWSSSLRFSSPLQNFLNHPCTICSKQFLGLMHCWCCELSLLLYDPFQTQIRKSLKFALLYKKRSSRPRESRWCDHWPRARHPGMWSQVGLRKHHYEQS